MPEFLFGSVSSKQNEVPELNIKTFANIFVYMTSPIFLAHPTFLTCSRAQYLYFNQNEIIFDQGCFNMKVDLP